MVTVVGLCTVYCRQEVSIIYTYTQLTLVLWKLALKMEAQYSFKTSQTWSNENHYRNDISLRKTAMTPQNYVITTIALSWLLHESQTSYKNLPSAAHEAASFSPNWNAFVRQTDLPHRKNSDNLSVSYDSHNGLRLFPEWRQLLAFCNARNVLCEASN